jgi:hypothetical protein
MAVQSITDLGALLQRLSDWLTQGQAIQAELTAAINLLNTASTANNLAAQDVVIKLKQALTNMGITIP